VGHETDYTICDLVADLRAPTPSAAAELVSPNIEDILLRLKYLSSKIDASIMLKLESYRNKVDALVNNKNFASPINRLKQSKLKLLYLSEMLDNVYSFRLSEKYNLLSLANQKLNMLNPSDILNRGYSIAYTTQNKILKDLTYVNECDTIKLRLSNGSLICKVITKEEDV
jgi:exodeoxyribonuclease VII large subunit